LVELVAGQKSASDLAGNAVGALLLNEEGQFALSVRLKNAVFAARLRKPAFPHRIPYNLFALN